MSIRFLLIIIGVCAATLVQAQNTRYVTDQLEVDIRTGKSLRHKIVRMLPAGTELTVLQEDRSEGYSLVRTEGGAEGWILTRYLSDSPIPRERLARAEAALAEFEGENSRLKEQLGSLQASTEQMQVANTELEASNQELSQELAEIHRTAANAIAIGRRNEELEQQMVDMERALQLVQQENQLLTDDSRKEWFLLGAGVLLFGVLLGWIGPRLRSHRRTRWGDL